MMSDALSTAVALVWEPLRFHFTPKAQPVSQRREDWIYRPCGLGTFILSVFFAPFIRLFPTSLQPLPLFRRSPDAKQHYLYHFDEISDVIPAFITIIMIPLSYSIATGIGLVLSVIPSSSCFPDIAMNFTLLCMF
jgi:hypothetical protein